MFAISNTFNNENPPNGQFFFLALDMKPNHRKHGFISMQYKYMLNFLLLVFFVVVRLIGSIRATIFDFIIIYA